MLLVRIWMDDEWVDYGVYIYGDAIQTCMDLLRCGYDTDVMPIA